jgi:hypothetical protein
MKAGQIKMWLDQGPAILMMECLVEAAALTPEEYEKQGGHKPEQGWVIHLLQTGEMLTVHEETLHNGEMDV